MQSSESLYFQLNRGQFPNGQSSQIQYTPDSGFSYYDNNQPGPVYNSMYNLKISESHSDYYTGSPTNPPLLSTTNASYLAFSNSNYLTANLLDWPSSIIISDGSGNKCAEADYVYDAPAQLVSSGVTMQHVSAPTPGILGNLTSVTRQLFSNPCKSVNPSSTPLTRKSHGE